MAEEVESTHTRRMLSSSCLGVEESLLNFPFRKFLPSLLSDCVHLFHLAVTKEMGKQVGHGIQYCYQEQLMEPDRTELRMWIFEDKLISHKKVRDVKNGTKRCRSCVANGGVITT